MGKTVIQTDLVMRPIAHFSHAVKVGDAIHLGATAGTDAARRLNGRVAGLVDAEVQTRQMFENAKTVLGLLGAGLQDVVKVKTYITDLRDQPIYQKIYREVFGSALPNHVVVGSAGFPLPQAAIELDLVALSDAAPRPIKRQDDGSVLAAGRAYCSTAPDAAPVGFEAQVKAAFAQIEKQLQAFAMGLQDAVYLHATLADCRYFPQFEAAFRAHFSMPGPACSLVAAPLAHPGMMIQLEAIAMAGGGRTIVLNQDAAARLGADAVLAGDELYIGAQRGDEQPGLYPAGVEQQTRAAWDKVKAVLAAAGMDAGAILRTNNLLVDWRDYAGFNAGYGANVNEPYPPRATVLGALSHPDARMQIEALAHRDGNVATIVHVPPEL